MMASDSEDEHFEDAEEDAEEDIAAEIADDATEEGDDESASEPSEDASEDEQEDDDSEPAIDITGDVLNEAFAQVAAAAEAASSTSRSPEPELQQEPSKAPSPAPPPRIRNRSLSPAGLRKRALKLKVAPRTFTVEAICALPHPSPTHALAASQCMSHLLTGSDDGYIRNYDIFASLNSKNFLSAPQRHHSGVVEGIMKAGQLRFWWENPLKAGFENPEEERSLAPVYSLAMHSDALWSLAGSDTGHINLFTVRHDPGRLCYTFSGHRGPISALSIDHDEKGFYSAGWDGEAIQWDLNTGQRVRTFTSHGAQLTCIVVRPINAVYTETGSPVVIKYEPDSLEQNLRTNQSNEDMAVVGDSEGQNSMEASQTKSIPSAPPPDSDAKSDVSFDPLFDDEPEDGPVSQSNPSGNTQSNDPSTQAGVSRTPTIQRPVINNVAPPKGAPPLLDPEGYKTFSPDILMTAAIDGQIMLWDKRVNTPGQGVGRLWMSERTPPWCLSACWSADGNQIYAGRRNGTVEIYDVRQTGRPSFGFPKLLKTLRNPLSSGVVSCVVGFPDNKHIACASIDNLRLWNVAEAVEADAPGRTRGGVQFKIIPGHHGGYISQMLVDSGARFLVSASSNRGWHGDSTRTVFVHDIKHVE